MDEMKNNFSYSRMQMIGDSAPEFKAITTNGKVNYHGTKTKIKFPVIADISMNVAGIPGDAVLLKAPLTYEEIDERMNCNDDSCDVKEWYLMFKKN